MNQPLARAAAVRPAAAQTVPAQPVPAQRLAALVAGRGATHAVLREQASLSWLLGARSHVPQTLDAACFDAVLEVAGDGTAAAVVIVANAIEAPRLRDVELVAAAEALAGARIELRFAVLPWWRSRDEALPSGPGVLSDRPTDGCEPLGEDWARLRRTLDPDQAGLLAVVCADAQVAAGQVAAALRPDSTEHEAVAALAAALLRVGAEPVALFAAGHARMAAHRHPLATSAPLGRRAMVACCARRGGLVASVTRIVSFDPLSDIERERYAALLRVEQAFLDASRPGVRVGAAFEAGAAAYGRNGFDPDEWHRHHQGGFSAWAPREYPAQPGSDDTVEEGTVLAWNPSGDGWKVEDTWLVGPDGPVALAHDDSWPQQTVGGRSRPGVLETG